MPNYLTELSPDNNTHVYQIKDKEAAPIDLLKDTVGWVGKNRLPITLDILKRDNTTGTWSGNTYTKNGVTFTFTFDEDGYLAKANINGTNSVSEQFSVVFNSALPIKASSYVFNGCPNGGGYSSYWIQWRNITDSSNIGDDTGNGIDYTFTADKTCLFRVYIAANATVSNKDFYPMLRDASIIDSTFEPYHESVEQTLRDAEVIKGKNGLNNVAPTRTNKDVTFTVNADKSVTRSGTASGGVAFSVLTGKGAENNSLDADYTTPIFKAGQRVVSLSFIQFKNTDGTYGSMNAGVVTTLSKDIGVFYTAVENGQSVSDTIYPMVCTEEEWNKSHDYEPFYIPLKDRLTELATVQESACTDIISGATVSEGQGGNHLYKKSGVVQMILGLEGVTVGAFSTFAKVPDGYKPIATMITNTFRTTGNQIYIAPNGNIQCASALNNANINIVATWITS